MEELLGIEDDRGQSRPVLNASCQHLPNNGGDDETRKFLGERGRLGRMTRAWMAIVQINGKRMPEVIVQCRRILEDSFLHIARQIRPKLERGMADRMGEA